MDHLAGKRNTWYLLSAIAILPGLIFLIVFGLNLGIDFTGGTNWDIRFNRSIETEEVRAVLEEHGFEGSVVQISSEGGGTDNVAVINMKEVQQGSDTKRELESAFRAEIGDFEELEFTTVGASVGNDISRRAVYAVALAAVGVVAYIAFAFRNTQNPFLYGVAAIVAMLHDVILVLGVFAILGKVADIEVDALFVTAVLTVIGFSVHDTIVVFDRIRENLARRAAPTFEGIVNYSIAQTIVRSLNTSMTVTFTLLALYLFGGESTQNFVLALLIGVISGTYSSIFNASQILVSWENGEIQRLFRRLTGKGAGPAMATSR
jgi:preprotein translocase subunit SecF